MITRYMILAMHCNTCHICIVVVKSLCHVYRLDVDKIVCEWVAFSQSKSLKLTVDSLDIMEREVKIDILPCCL